MKSATETLLKMHMGDLKHFRISTGGAAKGVMNALKIVESCPSALTPLIDTERDEVSFFCIALLPKERKKFIEEIEALVRIFRFYPRSYSKHLKVQFMLDIDPNFITHCLSAYIQDTFSYLFCINRCSFTQYYVCFGEAGFLSIQSVLYITSPESVELMYSTQYTFEVFLLLCSNNSFIKVVILCSAAIFYHCISTIFLSQALFI